ncbi:MAG TPA: metallophosphatase [Chitinophagales bacterium]|nr:metallophosphatase [Chitinophagales bacterium]HRG85781.1 metallophosphatase [Chitinophagales bacterium]
MQTRRIFLKKIALGSAVAGLGGIPLQSFAAGSVDKLVILHSNDVHSRIDPFPDNDKKFPGMGGMANKAAIIKKIRSEEDNVLLLDAGDIFQGTPYFNFYGGELEMKLMSEMQYDAGTMGNHDFDAGIDGFVKQLPHATFPILVANYDFTGTALENKIEQYKIFQKKNIKVGVFGLGIELKGLVPEKLYDKIQYLDPVEKAKEMVAILRDKEKCDYIICLSHLGYQYKDDKISDVKLAAQTEGIDLILGGHTHTFLDAPVIYKNLADKQVLINQVGWAGVWLGRVDIFFEKKRTKKWHSGKPVKVSKKTRE